MPFSLYEKFADRARWLTGICVCFALAALWYASGWLERIDLGPEFAGAVGIALTVGLIQGGAWLHFKILSLLCESAVARNRRLGSW